MKHTKEYAEKLAKKIYQTDFDRLPGCNNPTCRKIYVRAYMESIEETNHVEVLKALKEWERLFYNDEMCMVQFLPEKDSYFRPDDLLKNTTEAIRKAEKH